MVEKDGHVVFESPYGTLAAASSSSPALPRFDATASPPPPIPSSAATPHYGTIGWPAATSVASSARYGTLGASPTLPLADFSSSSRAPRYGTIASPSSFSRRISSSDFNKKEDDGFGTTAAAPVDAAAAAAGSPTVFNCTPKGRHWRQSRLEESTVKTVATPG